MLFCCDQLILLKNSQLGICIAYIKNKVGHQAFTIDNIDSNNASPSSLASRLSEARSGCGIRPNTLRLILVTPAILSSEPFGLASSVMLPASSQYLNNTWSLSYIPFNT